MGGAKFVGLISMVSAALAAQGCKTACEQETIERAVAFLKTHQSCEVDADCVVVSDYCEELPGGWCGQLVMNRTGSTSGEWASLDAELKDCSPSSCEVCAGGVIAACRDGSCGGP
jgi:hypothetical protein